MKNVVKYDIIMRARARVCVYVCMCVLYVWERREGERERERERENESFIYSDSPLTRCKAHTELINDVYQI